VSVATARIVCRVCGEAKDATVMSQNRGQPTRICRACNAAAARKMRGRHHILIDPCPVCGVRQTQHWRCSRCDARGHLIPRGAGALCAWCEKERQCESLP
jgi:hypothetical protein